MTDDEFYARFGDLMREPGEGNFVEIDPGDSGRIARHLRACDLWTMLDPGEGKIYLINGVHVVNRAGIYASERPYTSDEADRIEVVWFDDAEVG